MRFTILAALAIFAGCADKATIEPEDEIPANLIPIAALYAPEYCEVTRNGGYFFVICEPNKISIYSCCKNCSPCIEVDEALEMKTFDF